MIALIVLGLVAAFLLLPLRLRAWYDCQGAGAQFLLGFFPLWKYPNQKASRKDKKQKPKEEKEKPEKQTAKKGGNASEFFSILEMIFEFLEKFRRKLKVKYLTLHIVLAEEDPYDLGVHYGAACGAIAALEPQIDRFFNIKKKDYRICCDFEGDKSTVLANTEVQLPLITLLFLFMPYGFRLLGKLINTTNDKKGGAHS